MHAQRGLYCAAGIQNLLAFHPFRARELVTHGEASDDLDFRVQKDRLSRSVDEAAHVDPDAAQGNLDSDDFGIFAVAAEAMHDAGVRV
jgi:hypothetical protein